MTRLRPVAALAAAMFAAACADRAPVLPTATPPSAADAALIDRVVELGFARADIKDAGDHFVVEGDMMIRKADLRGTGPRPNRISIPGSRGQWKVTTPIQESIMRSGIYVDLSAISSNSAWLAATRAAMVQWEFGSGTNTVKFIESTASGSMLVSSVSLGGDTIARTGYPVSGYPGGGITLDLSKGSSLSAAQKTWIMIHEFGHAIGLRHSDWNTYGESTGVVGADSIPNTPRNDVNSVMKSHYTSYPSYSGFSQYDKVAAEYMYPAQAPTLGSVTYDVSGHPTFSWSAVPYAASYKIRFDTRFVEWVEDSSRYEGGYWGTSASNGDITTTTGTSYVGTETYTGDDWCEWDYQVWTVYASGKMAAVSTTATLPVCGPFPG